MCRVALLLNFIPPYRVPVLEALRDRVKDLRIFISTPSEPSRDWPVAWGSLEVVLQRNVTFRMRSPHPAGYLDEQYVHLPYDTFSQLVRYEPDVVISGELGLRTCMAAAYRVFRSRGRLIIWATLSEQTECNRGLFRERVRRCVLPRADAVLVNGRSGARYVKRFGVPSHRIRILPQTVNIEAFSAAAQPSRPVGCRPLLFVGRLVTRKGLDLFLSALCRWAEQHPARMLEFWIAGEGPEREQAEREPKPQNLTVRFLGSVAYERLPQVYADAGVLVFPTLADEWGLVVNEAMAAGVPVLGSLYSQAVEEMVVDGENGWTFYPDHPGAMYEAITRVLDTPPDELARIGLAARARALEVTPSDVADRMAEAIEWVTRASS